MKVTCNLIWRLAFVVSSVFGILSCKLDDASNVAQKNNGLEEREVDYSMAGASRVDGNYELISSVASSYGLSEITVLASQHPEVAGFLGAAPSESLHLFVAKSDVDGSLGLVRPLPQQRLSKAPDELPEIETPKALPASSGSSHFVRRSSRQDIKPLGELPKHESIDFGPPLPSPKSRAGSFSTIRRRLSMLVAASQTEALVAASKEAVSEDQARMAPIVGSLKELFPRFMRKGGGSSKIAGLKSRKLEAYASMEEYLMSLAHKPGGDIRKDVRPGFYSMEGFVVINGFLRAKSRGISDIEALFAVEDSLTYSDSFELKYDLGLLLRDPGKIAANARRVAEFVEDFDRDLDALPKTKTTVYRLDKLSESGAVPEFFKAQRTSGALSTAAIMEGAMNGAKDSDKGTKNFALRIFTPIGAGGAILRYSAYASESERLFRHKSALNLGLEEPALRVKRVSVDESGFMVRPASAQLPELDASDPETYRRGVRRANLEWARLIIDDYSGGDAELSKGDEQLMKFASQLINGSNINRLSGLPFEGSVVQFISIGDPTPGRGTGLLPPLARRGSHTAVAAPAE